MHVGMMDVVAGLSEVVIGWSTGVELATIVGVIVGWESATCDTS